MPLIWRASVSLRRRWVVEGCVCSIWPSALRPDGDDGVAGAYHTCTDAAATRCTHKRSKVVTSRTILGPRSLSTATISYSSRSPLYTHNPRTRYPSTMSTVPVDAIRPLADRHQKPSHLRFQYGTAGFRTLYVCRCRVTSAKLIMRQCQRGEPGIRHVQSWRACWSAQQEA